MSGDLIVALSGGVVEVLAPTEAGTFSRFADLTLLNPAEGAPTDPSAVQVLDTTEGLEVLVTNAGSDTLFVFALEMASILPSPLPPSLPTPGPPDGQNERGSRHSATPGAPGTRSGAEPAGKLQSARYRE